MATGGCIITDGDDDTDADTNNNQTSSNETDAETDTPETDGETDPPAETEGQDGTTTGGPGETEGETDPPATEDGTTTGGELGPCGEYGFQVGYCYMDEDQGVAAAEYCYELYQAYYDAYGEACQAAFVEYLACLSALDCKVFTGPDPQCEKEFSAIEAACVAG